MINEQSFQHHPDVGFEAKADWQPISKAPKDGSTLVLAWHHDWLGPRIVHWNDSLHQWSDPDNEGSDPTHWYPVPPLSGS